MTTDPDIIDQDTVNAARIFIAARIQRMGPGELADALADAGLLTDPQALEDLRAAREDLKHIMQERIDKAEAERDALKVGNSNMKILYDRACEAVEKAEAERDKAQAERSMAVGRVDEMRQRLAQERFERDEARDTLRRVRDTLNRVDALFTGSPDTPCRTSWHDGIECVEVPMDDLRLAFDGEAQS